MTTATVIVSSLCVMVSTEYARVPSARGMVDCVTIVQIVVEELNGSHTTHRYKTKHTLESVYPTAIPLWNNSTGEQNARTRRTRRIH